MFVSYLVVTVFTPSFVASWFGIDSLTGRETSDFKTMITIAAHLFITAGFFCATTLFYKEEKDRYVQQTKEFFEDVDTECVAEEGQDEVDRMQRHKLGTLVSYMGYGLTAMVLIPNPMWGRALFLGCAIAILVFGYLLKKSAKTDDSDLVRASN